MGKWLKINDSPIKWKIIALALFSTLIPLLVIGPFTFFYLSKALENKVSATIKNSLDISDWNIDTFINDIEDISNFIFLSTDTEDYLTHRKKDPMLYRLETRARKNLNSFTIVNRPHINAIYAGNENNGLLKLNRGESNLEGKGYSMIKDAGFYPELMASPWKGEWYTGSGASLVKGTSKPLLYGRILRNLGTKEQIGVLLIEVDPSIFEDMFNDVKTKGNIMVMDGDQVLYSRNDQIVSAGQVSEIIGSPDEEGTVIREIEGTRYVINYHTNQNTSWNIVSIIPYKSLLGEVNQVRWAAITLLLLALIVSLLVAVVISKRITKQLSLLRRVTEKMEQQEAVTGIHFNERDEIGKIGGRFVELYNRNNDLTVKLYKSQFKEKEAELLALQSHINPHFLYNTLNSIYWLAEKSKAKPISKMAISLSKIFKLTLNDGNPITTVNNEIEQIKSYLEIQNIRFNNKIHYSIDVSPDILEERIIKLILQPIVENSVYHGLEHLGGEGNITIKGYRQENSLIFKISDTGIGFDDKIIPQSKGYALKNINERLKLRYGDEYGVSIHSRAGVGTTVILKVGLQGQIDEVRQYV